MKLMRQGDLFEPDVSFCRQCADRNRRFALVGNGRRRVCLECEAHVDIHEPTTLYDLAPYKAAIEKQVKEDGQDLLQLAGAWGLAIASHLPRPTLGRIDGRYSFWPGIHVYATAHKDPALVLRTEPAMEADRDELFVLVVVKLEEWLVRIPGAISWQELFSLPVGREHTHWSGRAIKFPFPCWYVHEAALRLWGPGLLSDLVRVFRAYQKKGV